MPGTSSVRPDFANRLYLPMTKGTTIVLLDSESVNIYEHGVFIQGDKTSMKLKVTCTSPGPDPVPGKCRICNAMIKDERITRKFVAYLSCIDLAKFTIEGTEWTHTRKLVPLNNQAAKKLLRRQEEHGSLKGAMFKIYRNEQTSPTVGDDWSFLKRVKLSEFFANSPRIKTIRDYYAKRQGKVISPQEALQLLISPFPYETELEPTQKKIDYFLGYIGFGDAPKTAEPAKEDATYDYSDTADKDKEPTKEKAKEGDESEEEDFTDFEEGEEEDEPPTAPKKAKKLMFKKHKPKFHS
jgi:hypothetical protein